MSGKLRHQWCCTTHRERCSTVLKMAGAAGLECHCSHLAGITLTWLLIHKQPARTQVKFREQQAGLLCGASCGSNDEGTKPTTYKLN